MDCVVLITTFEDAPVELIIVFPEVVVNLVFPEIVLASMENGVPIVTMAFALVAPTANVLVVLLKVNSASPPNAPPSLN